MFAIVRKLREHSRTSREHVREMFAKVREIWFSPIIALFPRNYPIMSTIFPTISIGSHHFPHYFHQFSQHFLTILSLFPPVIPMFTLIPINSPHPVSFTYLRALETLLVHVCRLLLDYIYIYFYFYLLSMLIDYCRLINYCLSRLAFIYYVSLQTPFGKQHRWQAERTSYASTFQV